MLLAEVERPARPIQRRDWAYVGSTWQRSYEERAGVRSDVYRREQRRLIDRILETRLAEETIVVTCDNDKLIHAFAVGDHRGYLHYAYVAGPLRGKGIGRTLVQHVTRMNAPPIEVTHRWPVKSRSYVWNPYLLMAAA